MNTAERKLMKFLECIETETMPAWKMDKAALSWDT